MRLLINSRPLVEIERKIRIININSVFSNFDISARFI